MFSWLLGDHVKVCLRIGRHPTFLSDVPCDQGVPDRAFTQERHLSPPTPTSAELTVGCITRRLAGTGAPRSALDHVDRQAPTGCLLVLDLHVRAGLAHGL